mmetsp:Transcript_35547/g.111213  ORF Transcript_35547/g.111213 Transcript_35547/m.111213 type:complete len:220 (-) Transcript_35547:428-1087(-)
MSLHSCSKSSSVSITCRSFPPAKLSVSIIASSATVSVFMAPRTSRRSLKREEEEPSTLSAKGLCFSHHCISLYSISLPLTNTFVLDITSCKQKESTSFFFSSNMETVSLDAPRSMHINVLGMMGGIEEYCMAMARVSLTRRSGMFGPSPSSSASLIPADITPLCSSLRHSGTEQAKLMKLGICPSFTSSAPPLRIASMRVVQTTSMIFRMTSSIFTTSP